MTEGRGLSARWKLALSYAGFLVVAGVLMLAVVWLFLLRYVPDTDQGLLGISPNRDVLLVVFVPPAAIALAVLLVIGLVGGWFLAGRMLAPLHRISEVARLAANGSLSHRVRLDRRDEFGELADVFDTMLDRLESHVTEHQRFAANASHELRTPLAISQTILDVARHDPLKDPREMVERLRAVNKRAIDLTEALLLLSRADRGNFASATVDLSLVAEEAAETLLPLAEERGVTVEITGEEARTPGSAGLLARMVTNLVQNGIVHNLPGGGSVTVHTEQRHDVSVVRVENTGPRVPAVQALVEPFHRGTERVRTGDHAGVGLGLAIVDSVVRAHHGTLVLSPRAGGGLVVTVGLPVP